MKPSFRILALVFAGGALGTLIRLAVSFSTISDIVALFVVNLLGTAFLAWFNGQQRHPRSKLNTEGKRAFWGAGFAGGFTTMSGLALWLVTTVQAQVDTIGAIGLVLGQLVLGVFVYLGVIALVEARALNQPAILAEAESQAPIDNQGGQA